jgi:hypothetical protein
MQIWFPHLESRIRFLEPVEFLILVDGKTIRAAIEWSVIGQLLPPQTLNEQSVRDFIQRNRSNLELAMKAHLLARGVPFTHQFVVALDELRNVVSSCDRGNAELQ